MHERWTRRARLDDLEKKIDEGFAETKAEFRAVRAEIGAIRTALARDGLTSIIGSAAMCLTMILGFAAILLQYHL